MTEKVIDYTKSEKAKDVLKEWKDLEGTDFLEQFMLGAELDPKIHQLAMKKVPHLVKQSKMMYKADEKMMKQIMKSSKQTRKYYYKVSKSITKLLKRDDVAHELKVELLEFLKELGTKVEHCHERDQEILIEQHKKTVEYGTIALLTMAALYGVMTTKK